jgi:oligoendopeptidase F
MWVDASKKQITEKSVKHKGKNISLSEAFGIIPNLKRGERAILKKKIYEKLKEASFIAEAEINAVFSYKKITDELRGFTKPYEETVLKYENELSVVENLVDQVTKNFNISKKFYKIHSKLLKLKKIATYDTNIEISKINKKFDFQESVKIVAKSLRDFKPEYEKILLEFVKNGQIDSHPRIYKRGGAYNWGNNLLPTFLLLNHTDEIRSVETLAHEIGHAIHTELTKKQGGLYRDYSVSTAETASTFFEQVASLEIEKYLDKKDKITFLHHNIKNDIITIFRQIACFNFEKELHQKIRTDGFVTKDQIAKLLNKHTKSCIGDVLQQEDEDGYFFVSWSHIRSFFYVYSYAFGQLTSKALFKKWKEDKTFADKIEIFLKAGSSKSPEDIFKDMGIDLRDPEFFKIGLESIADDIKRLEKMIKQK